MFNCYLHDWHSKDRPCPVCHPYYTSVATTSALIPVSQNSIDVLKAEVEQLRTQLAGCGTAAYQNSDLSIKDRAKPGDYGWSASYGDVCRAVDREMRLRRQVNKLRTALNSIIAASYSWIIKENTAYIERPIHDKYRNIAQDALQEDE